MYALYAHHTHTDMSVLSKNRQLVFSIRNYIQDMSEIILFSISSQVKISLTWFLCFSSSFFNFQSTHIYLICNKKKITCRFEDMKFIFEWKKYFMSECSKWVKSFFHEKINFVPPCNILYIHICINLYRALIKQRERVLMWCWMR